jgi:hypothetical protein
MIEMATASSICSMFGFPHASVNPLSHQVVLAIFETKFPVKLLGGLVAADGFQMNGANLEGARGILH